MSSRVVDVTLNYKKSTKKLRGFSSIDHALRLMMIDFGFNVTSRSDRIFIDEISHVEIWEMRVPKRGGGASSGYRMLVVRVLDTDTVFLDRVWDRKDLNKPKIKSEYQTYLKKLKDASSDFA